jgi:hypothetical protein
MPLLNNPFLSYDLAKGLYKQMSYYSNNNINLEILLSASPDL